MESIESQRRYELRDVIGLTGLSKQVLHAWERRYGVVQPGRAADGARLYSDAEVHHLQLLKRCIDGGSRIGNLVSCDLRELKHIALDGNPGTNIAVEDILAAIRKFDPALIEDRLSVHFAGLGPVRFAEKVVLPLMTKIGSMWESGNSAVEAEHYVTAIVRTLLGQGLRLTQNFDTRTLIIFATPEGELHELGALSAAILAQSFGIRALYLGAQLPVESVIRVAADMSADVVCLSSTCLPKSELETCVTEITAGLGSGVELWLGGQAFEGLREDLAHCAFFFEDTSDYQDAVSRFCARMMRT